MNWSTNNIPDLTGKISVVTGGNGGLGLETVRQLCLHGAHAVIGARDMEKGQRALDEIQRTVPAASVEIVELDLASLASVESFSEEVACKHSAINLLFNNAGIMAIPEETTDDGFEAQFGTNHLGHFALTARLLPLLAAGAPSRVISTTSTARFQAGSYDLNNPHLRGGYRPWQAYGISKRANIQFAFELDRLLCGQGIFGYAADPGFSKTDLQPNSVRSNPGRSQRFWRWVVAHTGQTPEAGALPQLRAGTDPLIPHGSLIAPRWITNGPPILRKWGRFDNPDECRKLWEISQAETGLSIP